MFDMLIAAQDKSLALKPSDELRGMRHVRPLVDLIGRKAYRRHRHDEEGNEPAESACKGNHKCGEQNRKRDDRHIAVQADKSASEDVLRVDVMDAERPEKAGPDKSVSAGFPSYLQSSGRPLMRGPRRPTPREAPAADTIAGSPTLLRAAKCARQRASTRRGHSLPG